MIQNVSCLYMLSQRFRVKEQVATRYGGSSGADKSQVLKSPVPLAVMERCSREGCVPFAFPLYWMSMRRAIHRGNKHSRIKHPAVKLPASSFKGARKCHLTINWVGVTRCHGMLCSVRISPSSCIEQNLLWGQKHNFPSTLEVLQAGLLIK